MMMPLQQYFIMRSALRLRQPPAPFDIEVGLLTGGQDGHYAFGLASALVANGVSLDFIGSDEVTNPELHASPQVNFLNLRGNQRPDTSLARKISRVLIYYARLVRYAATASPRIFHILWNNKFELFDRTLLIVYYKLLGKKVALTAHNVNAGKRDSTDTLVNRLSLRVQYRLADHIFVHTEQMKDELLGEFGVGERAVTVIPYGINNAVPDTELTTEEARRRLGISDGERAILFFGNIAPYKGLGDLIAAFERIATRRQDYRLIIAGRPKKGCEKHWNEIQRAIDRSAHREWIIQRIEYIPDEETELYFKAADVLALPYTRIFQSGVLFFGYSFGLPVVAADVGALREDIIAGRTGFVCRPGDPVDLARAIDTYFSSDLYRELRTRRQEIRRYAHERHSWDVVGQLTRNAYAELLGYSHMPA
jgi:glycosyltransferase involved in cell wall biosynthesis